MGLNSVNWPMAIGASVLVHAIILGLMCMSSSPGEELPTGDDPAAPVVETPAPAASAPAAPPAATTTPSVSAPAPASAPSPAPTAPKPTVTPAPALPPAVPIPSPASPALADYDEYTVKSGDNLTAIAKKFNTNFTELAALNKKSVKQLSALRIGQIIKVPRSTEGR